MKYLESYDEMNESWRQVKLWLNLPKYIIGKLFSYITDYVSVLDIRYDVISAKVDTNQSINYDILKEEPIKLTIDDLKNMRIKNTLKFKSFFNEWNIYAFDREYENRTPVYITKDELKIGDKIVGERLSDHDVDSKYLKIKYTRDEMSKKEPQFYIVAAKYSNEHKEMRNERDIRYKEKIHKGLKKQLKKAIKNNDFRETNHTTGNWNRRPIAYKIAEHDDIELMKLLIEKTDKNKKIEIFNQVIDDDGWVRISKQSDYERECTYYSKYTVMSYVKSDEMLKLIEPYINNYLTYLIIKQDYENIVRYFNRGGKIPNDFFPIFSRNMIQHLDSNIELDDDIHADIYSESNITNITKVMLEHNLLKSEYKKYKVEIFKFLNTLAAANDIKSIILFIDYLGEDKLINNNNIFMDMLNLDRLEVIKKRYPDLYNNHMKTKKRKRFNL